MNNIIDVAAPGALRVFRSIYVPRGANNMLMYGVGRLAEFIGQLFSDDQSAYGMVRFYTSSVDEDNLSIESQVAGGHLEIPSQEETGLISEIVFTYRRRVDIGWSLQLMFYNLNRQSMQDMTLAGAFMTDFQAVLANMSVPVNVQDALFSEYIGESFAQEIDLEDDPAHTGSLYNYYTFRGVPLPVGITYDILQDSIYGVWLWCLYDMRPVDPSLSNFTIPPDFPLMPLSFIGGEPMLSIQGWTALSYDNVPISGVVYPRMALSIREGGEEYGSGTDEYFLSGSVPTMYTEVMYQDLREALDRQSSGRALTSSMRAVLAYASSVNRFV